MYIGLDLGTSGLKALLVDDGQTILATAHNAYPTETPAPGLAEQDPAHWLHAARAAMADLRAVAPSAFRKVQAIGLSGQMHSLLALDTSGQPLRPTILWNDIRGDGWCVKAAREHPEISQITGVAPMPSFTSAKLAWLKDKEPEAFGRIAHVLLPKDYLRFQLTGELATDPSDASGMQLLDQATRQWSGKMLEILGAPAEWFPEIKPSTSIGGMLRADLAAEFGLGQIPVAVGSGDAAASAAGTGCVRDGQAMISLGTGAVYLSAQSAYRPPQSESVHAFCHCLPDLWFSMTTLLSCGSVLDWACNMLGLSDVAQTMDRIAGSGGKPGRVLFLPYIGGTRTPVRDADVRGAFFGLDGGCDADTVMRAVIEGVGFALADADAELRASADVEDQPLIVGGGAKSLAWCRLLATILGRPVRRAVAAEGGAALGAARLAMLATGNRPAAEVCHAPETELVDPDQNNVGAYWDRFETFRAMFPAAQDFARRT